jgi:hypothetical protein
LQAIVAEGIEAASPQKWDGSAIHPYRSVSIGAAAPNFSLPNSQQPSQIHEGTEIANARNCMA